MADKLSYYVTFPDETTARDIARQAIERKLAACANIFPPHASIYRWQGKIEESHEVAAFFKTSSARAAEFETFVKSQHPYDTPCIVAFPIERADPRFAAWIEAST